MFVTANQLKELGACESQVQRFIMTFGTKAKISQENIIKARKAGLDVDFVMSNKKYSKAVESYVYPVGTKIRVKNDLSMYDGIFDSVVGDMHDLKGKVGVVIETMNHLNKFKIDVDLGRWNWDFTMVEVIK